MATATVTKQPVEQTLGKVLDDDRQIRVLRRILRQVDQLRPEGLALLKQQMRVR